MKPKTKSRVTFFTLLTTTLLTLLSGFVSFAWFINRKGADSPSDGSTAAAYFAYGNGTSESPYGIKNPRHLYNLAWLQYLGYFNRDGSDDDSNLDTVYFELAGDIDMSKLQTALPPIGTTAYPFIGNFNGKSHTVSNLTVSNKFDDFKKHPYMAKSTDFQSDYSNVAEIIGFFGVVGSYNGTASYTTSANQITNVGLNRLTVKSVARSTLIGLACGYLNGSMSGVPVENSSIDLSENLNASAISNITSNLSDYSLIGHAAKKDQIKEYVSSTTTVNSLSVDNPYYKQGASEWGGSIEMSTLYNNLHTKMENAASDKTAKKYSYTTYEGTNKVINSDGTTTTTSLKPITGTYSFTNGRDNYGTGYRNNALYYYQATDTGKKQDSTPVQTASYTFASKYSVNNYDDYRDVSDDTYVGLAGGASLYTYTYNRQDKTLDYRVSNSTIQDATTGYYLVGRTNGVSYSNSSSSATSWTFDFSTGRLSTTLNGSTYYLNADTSSGTLSLSTTASSSWSFNLDHGTIATSGYYLIYSGGSWKVSKYLPVAISYNGNYLTSSGTSVSSSKFPSYQWFFTNGTSGNVYTYSGSTIYYLYGYQTGSWPVFWSWQVSLTNKVDKDYLFSRSGDTINFTASSFLGGDTTYYLYYSNGWTASSNSSAIAKFSFTEPSLIINQSWLTSTNTKEDRNVTSNETYFPLTWTSSTDSTPTTKNTGYIVSGSNYSNTSDPSIGDIRFSSFYTTAMLKQSFVKGTSSSYSDSNLFAYTINSSGAVKIGDSINGQENAPGYTSYSDLGFQKYYYSRFGNASGSRVSLKNMLSSDIAYGLHFMNASISMKNLITIPYALVNGNEYSNYQLPKDSIDFNLKEGGYVNFFAHTAFVNGISYSYYTGTDDQKRNRVNWSNTNNSFFSLHWIERDGSTIQQIKEIDKIYKNKEHDKDDSQPQYVYTYRKSEDASTYDTGVKDEHGKLIKGDKGDLVFDTYWLTDPNYDSFNIFSVYYFEIPVNKGEYALGSTSGTTDNTSKGGWPSAVNKNGAYLMYLDIGSSTRNNDAIVVDEKITDVDNSYTYPVGVDFSSNIKSLNGDYSSVTGGDSSAILLEPSAAGNKSTYVYSSSTLYVSSSATLKGTYQKLSTSTKYGSSASPGNDIPIQSSSTTTRVTERETTYDLSSTSTSATFYDITATTRGSVTTTVDNGTPTTTTLTETTKTVRMTADQIQNIATFSTPDGTDLCTISYSSPIGSDTLTLKLNYDLLTDTYQLEFVTSSTTTQTPVTVKFTSLTTSLTYENASGTSEKKTISYSLKNSKSAGGTAVGAVAQGSVYTILPTLTKP